MSYSPISRYLVRPEDCDYLYFPVMKAFIDKGIASDDTIPIEDVSPMATFTMRYVRVGSVDGQSIFRFVGAV